MQEKNDKIIRIILNGRVSYFVEGGLVAPLITTEDMSEATKGNTGLWTIVKAFLKASFPTASIDIIRSA